MLYKDFLKTDTKCPFCDDKERFIHEQDSAFLTYCMAPYSKDHLMVIPKRHVEYFTELSKQEMDDVNALLQLGSKMVMKRKHRGYTILVRNGEGVGGSKKHIHFHIVPDIPMQNKDYFNNIDRAVLTPVAIKKVMEDLRDLKKRIFKSAQ